MRLFVISAFWSSLRRVTSGGRYVPEIDGLRFIAIFAVLLFHISELSRFTGAPLNPGRLSLFFFTLIHHGARGVPLFFAISGLVLGLPFARHHLRGHDRVPWRAYLWRRVTRLEPPYIANLILRAPLVMVARHQSAASIVSHFAVSLVYADWLVYGKMPLIHMPSWSLAVEVQFYLLAPILAWLLFRRNDVTRWIISLLIIAVGCWVSAHTSGEAHQGSFQLSLLYFSQYFVVGMLLADIYVTLLDRLPETWMWDIVALPLLIAFFAIPDRMSYYALPIIIIIVFLAAFRGRVLRGFLRLQPISILGGMCYSIYLTHSLTLQGGFALLPGVERKLGGGFTFWQVYSFGLAVVLPMMLIVSVIFFILIERPCMDRHWPRKLATWFNQTFKKESGAAA